MGRTRVWRPVGDREALIEKRGGLESGVQRVIERH